MTPPESLQAHDYGNRLRGSLWVARDETKRRIFIGIVFSFVLTAAYGIYFAPGNPAVYALAFLLLISAAPFARNMLNPPMDFELDATLFTVGGDDILLSRIALVEVRPLDDVWELAVEDQSGNRLSWSVTALDHPREDIEWLAEAVRERISS